MIKTELTETGIKAISKKEFKEFVKISVEITAEIAFATKKQKITNDIFE